MPDITIRPLKAGETDEALALVWEVFGVFEAPDYSEEGVREFYASIHDEHYLAQLALFGAFEGDRLVGVGATRSGGTHIALLFVRCEMHRRGIGRKLFDAMLARCGGHIMTVNSSPYAVEVYHRFGFYDTDHEQVVSGLRFTPMERIV